MNNCIRITNINRTEYAADIDQYHTSVGIEHKPYTLTRQSMNKILAHTTTWKPKFKPEYHARKT